MRNVFRCMAPHPFIWIAAVAVFLVNTTWIVASSRLSIEPVWFVKCASLLLCAFLLSAIRHFKSRVYDGFLHRVWLCAVLLLLGSFLSINFTVLNHLFMSVPFPMRDSWLLSLDKTLGLNWLDYALFATNSPLKRKLLYFGYETVTAYGLNVVIVLAVMLNRLYVVIETATLLVATTIVCVVAAAAFPAEAAFKLLATPDLIARLPPGTGTYHLAQLMELRSAPFTHLDSNQMQGLATFPSFHTVLGILIIWASRTTIWMFIPGLIAGLLVIASTPIYGGHYFVDLIAGAIVAFAAIAIWLRWLAPHAAKYVEETNELWHPKP